MKISFLRAFSLCSSITMCVVIIKQKSVQSKTLVLVELSILLQRQKDGNEVLKSYCLVQNV